jgi:D-arabinose 1-dehydrogenase-like Zn-dependent alcohol dehydrogenase
MTRSAVTGTLDLKLHTGGNGVSATTITDASGRPATAVPDTYRAAVVHSFDAPLAIEQVAMPDLEAHQVRVQIEACGLCHTDIHAAHGAWPIKPQPPFIPGHEGVGRVVTLGSGELHAAGLTRVISETRPLDQVNEAIADVEAGRVTARIVLEP